MNLREMQVTALRRWYVTLAGGLITVAGALGAYQVAPITYQAEAHLVLLPPQATVEPGGNPFLQLGGLRQVVDILGQAMQSREVIEPLTAAPGANDVTFAPDPMTSGPILLVSASGASETATASLLHAAVTQVPETLAALQTNLDVTEPFQVTSSAIVIDSQAKALRGTAIRAALLVAAAGSGFTLALLVATERLTRARGGQRPARERARALNADGKKDHTSTSGEDPRKPSRRVPS